MQAQERPGFRKPEKFEMMIANKYDEERMVIRFRGDMKSQNTALRDPT